MLEITDSLQMEDRVLLEQRQMASGVNGELLQQSLRRQDTERIRLRSEHGHHRLTVIGIAVVEREGTSEQPSTEQRCPSMIPR